VKPEELHLFERLLRDFSRERGVDLDAQAVVYNLYRVATDVHATMEASALQPHGLTHAGFVLLMALWISGPREVRELARLQRVSRPAIVSAVGTLERAGLARRVRDEADRRLVRVELTPEGQARIRRVHRAQHQFERAVSQALSRAEQRTLAGLLRRVGSAVAALGNGADSGE
jgi:DNA-binding MarR family transcriptional regulator